MGLGKQAKTLNRTQIKMISEFLLNNRYGLRDQTIFYFSVKCGLRSKEISNLKWSMVMNSDGSVGGYLNLPNSSSKGKSGRVVPLNKDLKKNLEMMLDEHRTLSDFDPKTSFIVRTERSKSTSPQSIVNMFQRWYGNLGLVGCSLSVQSVIRRFTTLVIDFSPIPVLMKILNGNPIKNHRTKIIE